MRNDSKIKKIAFISILVTLSIILGYIEYLFPIPLPIPGAKIGLPNIIILLSIFTVPLPIAILIQVLRIFLSTFLFGNFTALFFSLSGGMLSFIIMYLLYYFFKSKISIISISIVGAISHNIGQVIAASIMFQTYGLIYSYLPLLILISIPTGIFNGFVCRYLLTFLEKTNNLPQFNKKK
jgi:heptaprenyl diphosphate synthase